MADQAGHFPLTISSLLQESFPMKVTDRHGTFTYVNDKFCKLSKYDENELIGQHVSMLQRNVMNELILSDSMQVKKRHFTQKDAEYVNKYGQFFWGQTTTIFIRDSNDNITHFASFIIDTTKTNITKGKYIQAIEDLRKIENALNEANVVAITNRQGVITYVNKKFCELSQYDESELIGQTHNIINSGYHSREFFKDLWRTIGTGNVWEGDIKNRAKDGTTYWVSTTIIPIKDKNGKPYQYISIRTDITNRIRAEMSLQKALKNDFNQTVKNLHNIIFKYNEDDEKEIVFTLIEGKMARDLNLTVERFTMNQIKTYYGPVKGKSIEQKLRHALQGNVIQFELFYKGYTFLLYLSPIIEGQTVTEVVGTVIDITDRKEAETLIHQMAFYDFLTQLPNRRMLQQEANKIQENHKVTNDTFAFMFIDLDRFKNINDSFGHAVGDKLIKQFSKRLKNVVRKSDIVARFGGDEFIVLLPRTTTEETEVIASNIVKDLSQPYIINNLEIFIAPNIGISMYPKDGEEFDTLLTTADVAMNEGKKLGEVKFQFFTEQIQSDLFEQTMLEMDLRQAVDKGQFELFYQPQQNLKTNELTGVEALIRWNHPTEGYIPPNVFIPIAEETGMIVPIGQWVLETASRQLKKWHSEGFPLIKMAVNISIIQFEHPLFVERVKKIVDEVQLDPSFLNLEITESMIINEDNCQTTLRELRKLGVDVSIDDFGTGYSSLSYLSQLPITHLKIDQFFIHDLSESNQAIVKIIINLAKYLNLKVIAEGVEEKEHEQFLKQLDCDEAQGYYYARPMQVKRVEEYMNNNRHNLLV